MFPFVFPVVTTAYPSPSMTIDITRLAFACEIGAGRGSRWNELFPFVFPIVTTDITPLAFACDLGAGRRS